VPGRLWQDADDYARRTFPKLSLPFVEMHMALFAAATGNHAALDERLTVIEQRLAGRCARLRARIMRPVSEN
jgi:hypothetical protein